MDWRSVTFDWNRARAFLVTAEEGSLSAAARALSMAQPTLSRQVAALEEELGVLLFDRVGRGLTLTPSGLELLDHVRAMGEAAGRVSLTATGQAQAIEGTVRITATEAAAAYVLPPIIGRLREAAPGIELEIVATNTQQNLRRREADIAIRGGTLSDPELIARRIKAEPVHLYASPAYLERVGPLETAEDAARATYIGFEENADVMGALLSLGLPVTKQSFPVRTASHLVHWELVRAGVGIGLMPSDIGDRDPAVTRAMPWLEALTFDLWLVSHRELRTSRRVRLVFDFLAEALAGR